jgi:hypothetical protein
MATQNLYPVPIVVDALSRGGSQATTRYRMRGIDTTCAVGLQPAYVYWTVEDEPDWSAAQLSPGDLPCGTDPATDVDSIVIAASWVED